jgi:hypothetical protein
MFDNGDVTRIINTDRAEAGFFGTNRRLFFRAMFDSTYDYAQTTGLVDTFIPVIDFW